MKRVMKSALVALIIMLIGASAFAVDFAASVNMAGDVWGTNGFKLADQNQKDADLLVLSVSTDNAGASGNIYTGNAADGSAALVRNLVVWFKPVSMLKVSIGNLGSGLFTEQLNWWMVPTAAAGPDWSGDAGVAGKGVALELKPIADLTITAGIAPGFGNTWMIDANPVTLGNQLAVGPNTAFGLTAKYKLGTIGNIGAGYRFNGAAFTGYDGVYTTKWQTIRLGMDFTMVPGLYAFVTGIFRMDNASNAIDGIAIDNYVAYTAGALTAKAEFPVVIRLTDNIGADGIAGTADDDSGYLTYDVKVSYKVLDNCSPFLRLTQNGGLTADYGRGLDFDDIRFAPVIQLGADYSFGKASLMTAIKIELPVKDTLPAADADLPVKWSIPFTARVSF